MDTQHSHSNAPPDGPRFGASRAATRARSRFTVGVPRKAAVCWQGPSGDEISLVGRIQILPGQDLLLTPDDPAADRPRRFQPVTVHVPGEDGLYVFEGRVAERQALDGLRVEARSGPRRLNRRRFSRVMVHLPTATILAKDEHGKPTFRLPGRVIDISAGGVRFRCAPLLESGDQIDVILPLEGGPPLQLEVAIVAVERAANRAKNSMLGSTARGFFVSIERDERQRILRYVEALDAERPAASDDAARLVGGRAGPAAPQSSETARALPGPALHPAPAAQLRATHAGRCCCSRCVVVK